MLSEKVSFLGGSKIFDPAEGRADGNREGALIFKSAISNTVDDLGAL
jgi:hypothetical protein